MTSAQAGSRRLTGISLTGGGHEAYDCWTGGPQAEDRRLPHDIYCCPTSRRKADDANVKNSFIEEQKAVFNTPSLHILTTKTTSI